MSIPTQNSVFLDLSLDTRILGFVLEVAGLTSLLFGLLPALHLTRVSLSSAMKGSQSSEAGRSLHFHMRKWIVGSQVALSLVLLVAAGLLLRSFVKLVTLDVGFDRNNILLVHTDLRAAKIPLREENLPTAFLPLNRASELGDRDTLELHTAIPPSRLIVPVLAAVAEVSSAIPLEFQTLADQVNDSLVQERLLALLSVCFGALALILAMIGLYGTFSYLVTQRQTEFGVRMALGAEPASILALVMRDLIAVLAGGLVAGILISLAATRVLQQMLYGLAPRDTTTMVLAAGVLSAVALLAGYIPARRATRVDPMTALRQE
jgi:hypothetical protein